MVVYAKIAGMINIIDVGLILYENFIAIKKGLSKIKG